MSRVVFKRAALTDPFKTKPGEWVPVTDYAGTKKSAIIRCPVCGELGGALFEWDISNDGTVNPSVDHSHNQIPGTDRNCTFHEFIRLEGWAA